MSSSGPFLTSVPPMMAHPELLVRVDVRHDQVHVSHPEADLVRLDELRERGGGNKDASGDEHEKSVHGSPSPNAPPV